MYIKVTRFDTANGIGIRDTLWFAGCEHHCEGCHNPETWNKDQGEPIDKKLMELLIKDMKNPHIYGVTLSGGDPLAIYNRQDATDIIKTLKALFPEKSFWCYTGYNWEEVKNLEIMKYLDILVDGKFLLKERNIRLPYCGSNNQRVINVQKSLLQGEVVTWENSSL